MLRQVKVRLMLVLMMLVLFCEVPLDHAQSMSCRMSYLRRFGMLRWWW